MLLVTTQVMGTVRDNRHYAKKGQPPPGPPRGSMSSSTNYYVPRKNKNKNKKPTTTIKPPAASKQQVYNKPPAPKKQQGTKPNRTLDLFRGAVSKLLSIGRVKLDFHNVAYSPMVAPVISIKKI